MKNLIAAISLGLASWSGATQPQSQDFSLPFAFASSVTVAGTLTANSSVTASYFIGNGAGLTGVSSGGSGSVDFSTITSALNTKLSSGTIPSGFVSFSTITSALNTKLSSGAIPSGFVDFSTITTAIGTKQNSFTGISSSCASGFYLNLGAWANGVTTGGTCTSASGSSFNGGTITSSLTITGNGGGLLVSGDSVTANSFFGDGSHLTGLSASFTGGAVANQTTFQSTVTIQGNAFSVGGSSFTVAGGSITTAYRETASQGNFTSISTFSVLSSSGMKISGTGCLYFGDGTYQCTAATGGGGSCSHGSQSFTASGTFTKPSSCSSFVVTCMGAGGGGGTGVNASGYGGGGGGSGERILSTVTLTGDVTVTIGAGGSAGGDGGGTTFGSFVISSGGLHGFSSTPSAGGNGGSTAGGAPPGLGGAGGSVGGSTNTLVGVSSTDVSGAGGGGGGTGSGTSGFAGGIGYNGAGGAGGTAASGTNGGGGGGGGDGAAGGVGGNGVSGTGTNGGSGTANTGAGGGGGGGGTTGGTGGSGGSGYCSLTW